MGTFEKGHPGDPRPAVARLESTSPNFPRATPLLALRRGHIFSEALRSCSLSAHVIVGGEGRGKVGLFLSARALLLNQNHLTLPALTRGSPPSPPRSAAEREHEPNV